MKKTIAIALVGAALLGGAATASAQQGQGQGQQGQGRGQNRMMEVLFKDITLTADQQKKVDSVVAAYRAQMPQMTPGTPPSEEDRAKRRELQTKQQADLRALLTTEQQTTFDKNVEAMRANMGRQGQGGGGRPPAR